MPRVLRGWMSLWRQRPAVKDVLVGALAEGIRVSMAPWREVLGLGGGLLPTALSAQGFTVLSMHLDPTERRSWQWNKMPM